MTTTPTVTTTTTTTTNASVLITGAGGMLAQALAASLRRRGTEPVLLNRAALDVTHAEDVRRAFDKHRPKVVINCAAHTKVDLCEEQEDLAAAINGAGPENLARAAVEHGTRLVHYSTDFVFDGSATRPYRPDDPVNPLSAYGRSKLLGEQAIARVNPRGWLVIRTAWLYGPGGPCFPQTMINAAKAGKPLKVVADQVGSPTFTRDLAEATLDLIEHHASGLWHLTNSGSVSWHGFTAAILEEFGLTTDLSTTTSAEWKRLRPASATRPAYSVLDVEPFARLTGRPMRPWRQALHDYRVVLGA
jgi:dTDP-4-dehydrorhamnose reductase